MISDWPLFVALFWPAVLIMSFIALVWIIFLTAIARRLWKSKADDVT